MRPRLFMGWGVPFGMPMTCARCSVGSLLMGARGRCDFPSLTSLLRGATIVRNAHLCAQDVHIAKSVSVKRILPSTDPHWVAKVWAVFDEAVAYPVASRWCTSCLDSTVF